MRLFALNQSRDFGLAVAAALGRELDAHEERNFEDGEQKSRPLVPVRGRDVYVIQSLHGGPVESAHDKLCRLLFFLATVRDHGAARVTAVMPYFAYGRKDRRTKPRDPVTTRYMAQLLEAMGVDAVMTLDVHNIAAFQNAFRCHTEHLDTRRLFAQRALALAGDAPVVVASPDPGGVKRAQLFRETFETGLGRPVGAAWMDKRRSAGRVTGTLLTGEVQGAVVLVIDDLISTGGTMLRAAETCLDAGAREVHAFAAHGLFTGGAAEVVADMRLAGIYVTDTVPPFRLAPALAETRLEIISAAPLFAEAIRRCHKHGSLVSLLETEG